MAKAETASGKTDEIQATEAPSASGKRVPRRAKPAPEVGGPAGLEPTRYGDWERKGICSDF